MQQHYGEVKRQTRWPGAVTYFGFLSFFPIMALAFAVVGYIAQAVPEAEDTLVEAVGSVLPGLIGDGDGQVPISTFQDAAGAAVGIGAIGVLYSGLGWLSGMRDAMMLAFEMPQQEQPNFLVGKARDLVSLVAIGATLLISVAIAGLITSFSDYVLDWFGLDSSMTWLVSLLGVGVGLLANMLLFFTIFRLLANPPIPAKPLWKGALLGAVGFEVLKWASQFLIASTKAQPAFTVFGIALILVVWINYMSRLMVYAASWAHTDPAARAARNDLAPAARLSDDGRALEERVRAAREADVPTPVTVVAPARPAPGRPTSSRARDAVVAGLGAAHGSCWGVVPADQRPAGHADDEELRPWDIRIAPETSHGRSSSLGNRTSVTVLICHRACGARLRHALLRGGAPGSLLAQ